jgi:integrase
MERENLTPERIKNFTTDKGQAFLWDAKVPRLALRATAPSSRNPEGSKAFIFQGKFKGQDIRITIGKPENWTIERARKTAGTYQALIDDGKDPRIEKREQIANTIAKQEEAARIEAPALDLWTTYVDTRKAKWSASHLADHMTVSKAGGELRTRGRRRGESDRTQPGALRPLLALPLRQIDADQVREWLKEEAEKRPTHARLAYGLLRAFLNWCGDQKDYRDQVHTDACAARLAREELPKKRAKDDCLQREQLPLWFEHVRKLANPVHAAYLQTLLLTGARREELAGLTWEHVDFQWKSLTIRDKVDGERTIPLTPFVAALLYPLPRRTMIVGGKEVPNPWVFSSPTAASGRLQEPRIGHNKALTAAGLPDLSLHGLRRSFGTLAEWVECPAGVVAQIQGHKPSATAEKHYRVRPLDLLRMWHTKIEAWILSEAGLEQPAANEKAGLKVVSAG